MRFGEIDFHKLLILAANCVLLCGTYSTVAAQGTISSVSATDVLPSNTRSVESRDIESRDVASLSINEAKPTPSPSADPSPSAEPIIAVPDPQEPALPRRAQLAPFDAVFPGTEEFGVLLQNNAFAEVPSDEQQTTQANPKWQYGGFVDLGYLLDFNHPSNHLFRSRGTAFRVDSVFLNMAAAYLKKRATEESRWGVELTVQAGKDDEFFGFSATAPNIAGFKFLRHLGPTNASYLAPLGKGLAIQAGIFTSLIGYDSLYAKDNLNYTRPWGADFTPYFMMGANASYPFTEKLTGTFFVVNGYWHLARANSVPSSGGQVVYKFTPQVTLKETVLFGPHQSNTAFRFWRFLTDTIVERKTDRLTFAFEYIYSGERVDTSGDPRALMMSGQLPIRWTINDRWMLAVRPEVFWDRDGRWTLARQTVKAFATTVEYHVPYEWTNSIFRLEYRWDDSRGREGGFFRGSEISPGVPGLTPSQHLLIFATIFSFDSPVPR